MRIITVKNVLLQFDTFYTETDVKKLVERVVNRINSDLGQIDNSPQIFIRLPLKDEDVSYEDHDDGTDKL